MSLGFEVDFLALIGLVNQVRKSFAGAPEQFKAISDDVRGFSIVLQDVEANYTDLGLEQTQEYQEVVTSCKHLLEQLEKSLEKYSGVAEARKAGKKAGIKRVWKRLKWEPDDIRDIRSQISFKIATLRSLNDQVTSQNIIKLIHHQEYTEREATVKWVSDINYVAQQNDIFLRCQTGSRKWLFESEVYLEWCKRKGSLLFCPGNPGTGKTFTTAMVVESLRLANDAETLTTYMYCTYQNHTQTIEKLLCSLLRVALEEADCEADGTVSTCRQLRLSNKTISRQNCLGLLQDLFSRFTRVNLIVDALDELTNEVRRPLIYDLLKLHKSGIVSLLVTSRGIPEIQHLFKSCEAYTSLEVRSSDEDIRTFLRDNIFQLSNFVARSQKLQDEVINSVTNASAGMFLLAELYLKSLANIISVGSLRTRLSNLATGSNAYDALYEDSMLRIGFQGPELEHIALQMLLVLTCARRPLSPKELSHALSIDENSKSFDEDMIPDMDDLIAACTGLAVLDDTSNIVHLVHKSAAEYFERTRSRWFPRANEKMAFMCLRYLQIVETESEETKGEDAPFFHYAKANWGYHSMESEKEAAKGAVMIDALQTNSVTDQDTSPHKLAVTQLAIQQMTKEIVDVDSSIIEACHAGHQAWVEQLLVIRNYDANTHGKFLRDEKLIIRHAFQIYGMVSEVFKDKVLLTIAAARGDYSMAQMLLVRGADPNIFNAQGQTPLLIAVMNGFDELVSLLLDHKLIKPDLMCRHSGALSTAFLTSIEYGREGCFRMLLEKSNRGVRDSENRGAMWLAATSGHTSIISELLKWPDVEIDYTDADVCGNPLTAAVRARHEEAALLLLPYSKCRSCIHCGATPMHYAVRNRLHNLLERLLKHDASAVDSELHSQPQEGQHFLVLCDQYDIDRVRTPLTTAISLRDAQAIQLLLPHANLNQGLNTWRPLHGAAEWGNAEIFQLLLKQEGIELDPVDEHGRTPFLLAAERGRYDIMKALIQKGDIQLNIRNKYNMTPFLLMADCENLDMMNILIQNGGIQLDIRNEYGETPIFQMVECRESDMMNALIQKWGIQFDIRNEYGETPIFQMAERENCDMLNALIKVLIKVGGIRLDGNDALSHVAAHYFSNHFPNIHVDCFHVLTSILDVDINSWDLSGSTFLHRACSLRPKISIQEDMGIRIFEAEILEINSGHLVAELLKRPGINVNSWDHEENTPLLLAVKNHQRDVVRLLLEREDTDLLAEDEKRCDALLLASLYQPMFTQLFSENASSLKAEIPPLSGQVPIPYRVDHWPEVLNAEFKEYAESIFSMLLHDKRIDLTTMLNEEHTYLTTFVHDNLYHCWDKCRSVIGRVVIGGTKSMVQAVLEVTNLESELKILSQDDRSLISYALEENEDDEAVELMIAHCSSAVLQKADAKGRTLLSFAVKRATSLATQALLKAGVNTNAADRSGETPLSYAAKEGHPDTARLLLAADETLINIPSCNGFTPLMHASRRLNIPVVSVFLERPSVDLLALDGKGHSFLCRLMKPRYSNISRYGLEKRELDGVIHHIHHLLQPHVSGIEGYIHSPFLCTLESHEKQHPRPDPEFKTMYNMRREKTVEFMNNLQRYTILLDFFHPGLDFSRCTTTAGLLELLGEKKHGDDYDDFDRRTLCIRALRLYVKKDT